ncbi:EAL domain-containing protein [Dechloromonas hortensis]|uniref:EAL domain-containing protein n=1 Tax=Dechloromonas hortensis TaxID=337779 RepID=UPI0012923DD8|nr:EAL domain-containing protein [Dechloromonas hortensis]
MPKIAELISSACERVSPDTSLGRIANLMLDSGASSVIVVDQEIDQDKVLGIVTESDMLRIQRQHLAPAAAVRDIMTQPVHCVPAAMDFRQAYREAASLGIRHIIVIDESGKPLGVVSEADLRRHLGADFFHHLNSVDTLMERLFPRLPATATLDEALAAMEAVRASCAVVVAGRQPLGIVTERDVVRLFARGADNPQLGAVMTQPPISIHEDSALADAAQCMLDRGIRHLTVVDRSNRLVGLLSEHALMRPLKLDLVDDALADRLALTRQRDQTQDEKARNERYQRALLDNFPYLVWLKDTESRFLAVNRVYATAVGETSTANLIGKSDFDFWPAELAERYRADDAAVMASQQKKIVAEPIARTEGLVWHETYKAPVVDDDGALLGTVGFALDISRQRRSEEAILLRNAALAGLIRNEPLIGVLELIVLSVETEMPAWTCAIQLLDDDGLHLRPFAAPRLPDRHARRIGGIPLATGGTAAFLQQRVLLDEIADQPYWEQYREAAREAGFAACWSEPILSPQGQLLGTFAAYNRKPGAPSDENLALLTHSSQLTALILAHQQGADRLQNSLDTFRGIFDSISEAVFIQSEDGSFLDVNVGAEALFGYPRSELLGQTQAVIGTPGLNDMAATERHIKTAIAGTPQYFEYWACSAGGRIFPVDVRLHPGSYFGRPVLIASVVDIGERKRAALRLEIEHDLAQALAAGLQREEVLSTILKAALRFPDLDAGCIYQRTPDGGYRLLADQGLSAKFVAEHRTLPADHPQARSIADGKLVCSCNDFNKHCNDDELIASPDLAAEGLRCLTVLPVLVAGQAVAGLYLAGRQASQISPDTLQALETLAGNFGQTLLRLDAQEEAARLQHNLSGLFNALTDLIFIFDTSGRILHHNQAVNERLGYPPDTLKTQHIAAVHPPETREMATHYLGEIVAGQRSTCPLPLLHADGSPVMVDTRIITGYWDGQPALIAIAQDIRERLIAEERQKLAASVFDNAHEGIMITDPAGRIVEVNGTFSELTGYARSEAIGQTADLLKSGHHPPEFYATMWQTIREQGFWRGEVWNRKKTGEIFAELLTISTVRNRDGAVSHFVGIFSDITLIKEHQKRLEHLAHFDALTQLPNRMLLGDRMQLAMAQSERNGKTLAVCYLDLDGFKPVNDQFGHAIGDRLLVEVGQRLKGCVRAGDTVSRLGGDEFVLLFSDLDDVHECDHAIGRVIGQLTTPFRIGGYEISISASIGVTLYPQDGSDSDTLLRHADQAMYAAKQAGRNRFHLFDPENDRRARLRREEISRIRQALNDHEFVLHYQPKVDMRQGSVIGAEALIRWQHPERGLLLPADFLPAIEGSELSITLGDWVIREALQQLSRWRSAGLEIAVSVNIAGNHLQAPGFAARLGELLAAHPDVPPHSLELEVLETAALEDIANVAALFAECRRHGVSFSLDDFGTGYSSLTYFRRLPADILKIDQSFVRDMLDDPDDLAIVEGVIGLTRAFQRKVIAEGVETVEHGMVLLQLGCDMAQGFGIARPMPAGELPGWVDSFRPDELWSSSTAFLWSRDDLPMLIAEVEHKRWKLKLQAYLDDTSGTLPAPHDDHQSCRFGRWYYGPHSQRYRALDGFAELEQVHRRLHEIGRELCAGRGSDEPASRPLLAELEELASQMSSHLQQIQAEVLLSDQSTRR